MKCGGEVRGEDTVGSYLHRRQGKNSEGVQRKEKRAEGGSERTTHESQWGGRSLLGMAGERT